MLKEAGKRVLLTDLVQDIYDGKKSLESLEEGRRKSAYTAQVYFRNAMRSLLRIGGDFALLYGVHEAYEKQDIKHIGFGVVMCAMGYLMDHIIYEQPERP